MAPVGEKGTNCWQITGPPGTGKTTYLANQAKRAAEAYGPAKILVASLTRAAAHEFSSRGLGTVPREQLGTLHSICLRALGNPELIEKRLGDWNEYAVENGLPNCKLTDRHGPKGLDLDQKSTHGDELLHIYNVARNHHPLVFVSLRHDMSKFANGAQGFFLRGEVLRMIEVYEAWKAECGLMDFTDLLEQCLLHTTHAPGNPRALFGDEVQDWSKLEVALFRDHWGQHAERVVLVGDPDQAIYEWRGADPKIFLDHPVPEEQKILLSQSYRVPSAVRDCALTWIERKIQDRDPVKYEAVPERKGTADTSRAHYKRPELILEEIRYVLQSEIDFKEPRNQTTWMILGSCHYMLAPIIKLMKSSAVPIAFHNPYRNDPKWNPLTRGRTLRGGRVEIRRLDRILAFLAGDVKLRGPQAHEWTPEEIELWLAPLRAAYSKQGNLPPVVRRGAMDRVKDRRQQSNLPGAYGLEAFGELFHDGWEGEHARRAWQMDLAWWLAAMKPSERPKYEYLVALVNAWGPRVLVDPPRVTVGTIHSVKGGETDHVFLFPDLSNAAYDLWLSPARDQITRMFYVAMTRAKRTLTLCQASSPQHPKIAATVGGLRTRGAYWRPGARGAAPPETVIRSELLV